MKNTLWIAMVCGLLSLFAFNSCKTGVYATEHGKDDIAFVCFYSSGIYANKTIDVVIDKDTAFSTKVVKAKQDGEKRKGELYGIKTGKRHICVSYNGNIIYEKDIYVTSQQTKEIIL